MENTDSQRHAALHPADNPLVPAAPSQPLAQRVAGIPPDAHYVVPPFDPVPVKPRHDGWTPERQRGFIEALAATACVADAARCVGMSETSAYNLYARPDASAFRAAWDAALQFAVVKLEAAIFSRAIHGVPVPHYYKGELVGEHRKYDDRLAMFVMNHYGMGDEQEALTRSVRYCQQLGWLGGEGAAEQGDEEEA